MSGPIVRTGTNPKFWTNWERAFGKDAAAPAKKAAVKKAAAPKAAKKAAKKTAKKAVKKAK